MRDTTPLPETMEYGQLTVETLDVVAARLKDFTERLIRHLRGVTEVQTGHFYLLNSTDHPVEVPVLVGGVPIEMQFDATLPIWALAPRARLQISFNHGPRRYWTETTKSRFPFSRVLRYIIESLQRENHRCQKQREKVLKQDQARTAFQSLGESVGIEPTVGNPGVLARRNVRVVSLPDTPTRVQVTLVVPIEQATEIISKYGKK